VTDLTPRKIAWDQDWAVSGGESALIHYVYSGLVDSYLMLLQTSTSLYEGHCSSLAIHLRCLMTESPFVRQPRPQQ
jgi:hypothetical protein